MGPQFAAVFYQEAFDGNRGLAESSGFESRLFRIGKTALWPLGERPSTHPLPRLTFGLILAQVDRVRSDGDANFPPEEFEEHFDPILSRKLGDDAAVEAFETAFEDLDFCTGREAWIGDFDDASGEGGH